MIKHTVPQSYHCNHHPSQSLVYIQNWKLFTGVVSAVFYEIICLFVCIQETSVWLNDRGKVYNRSKFLKISEILTENSAKFLVLTISQKNSDLNNNI